MNIVSRIAKPAGAMALAASLVFGGSAIATAEPAGGYKSQAKIDSIEFDSEGITNTWRTEMKGTWSLPDNPATPAGVVVSLPDSLKPVDGTTFPMNAEDGKAGECTVRGQKLDCAIDEDYIKQHPRKIEGTFALWVEAQFAETGEQQITVENVTTTVTVKVPPTGGGTTCTENCEFKDRENSEKYGEVFDSNKGTLIWYIHPKVLAGGHNGGEKITITEKPGPGHSIIGNEVAVVGAPGLKKNEQGREIPDYQERTTYQLDENGSFTFTAQQGYYYSVEVKTQTETMLPEYKNTVEVTISSETEEVSATQGRTFGGTATIVGEDEGAFIIAKAVSGAAKDKVPADFEFEVTYTVTSPEGEVETGTCVVTVEAPCEKGGFVPGSTVEVTETQPADGEGFTWGEPIIEPAGEVTLEGGVQTMISVTNEAIPVDNPQPKSTPTPSDTPSAPAPSAPTPAQPAKNTTPTASATPIAALGGIALLMMVAGVAMGARKRESL